MNPPLGRELDNPAHVEGCDAAGAKPDAEPVDREYVTVHAVFCVPVDLLRHEPDEKADDDWLKATTELKLDCFLRTVMRQIRQRYTHYRHPWPRLADAYQECRAVEVT